MTVELAGTISSTTTLSSGFEFPLRALEGEIQSVTTFGGRLSVTMAGTGVIIQCIDPMTGKAIIFERSNREHLRFDSVVNGGDHTATWSTPCDKLPPNGLPDLNSRVSIINLDRNTYLWVGILREPKLHYERGKPTSAEFEATGAGEILDQFPESLRFGSDIGESGTVYARVSTGTVITQGIDDAVRYGLSRAPLVTGESSIEIAGLKFSTDTEDFRGRTPPDLWTSLCSLTARFGTPYIWMVEPDSSGLPGLHFLARPANPEYFEQGTAKSAEVSFDAREIANVIYGQFEGNRLITRPDIPNGDPIDYSQIPDMQTHYVDVSEEIREYNQAKGFIEALLAKFNVREITSGSIVLDKDLKAHYTGSSNPEIIPFFEVRAGKRIRVALPGSRPYLSGGYADMFIETASYDEDACQITLTPRALSKEGRDMRMLTFLPSRALNWSILSRYFNPPTRDLYKILEATAQIPGSPTVDGFRSGGGSIGPPPPPNPAPEESDKPVQMRLGLPLFALTDTTQDLGRYGGWIHPLAMAPDRFNFPTAFTASDPQTGELIDGDRAGQDVQEGYADTFTVRTLGESNTSVIVHVDVFHWNTLTRDVDLIPPITLTNEPFKRVVFEGHLDNPEAAPETLPVKLHHDDHLIWRVSDVPATDVILEVAVSGWKAHDDTIPYYFGPDWVPTGSEDA